MNWIPSSLPNSGTITDILPLYLSKKLDLEASRQQGLETITKYLH